MDNDQVFKQCGDGWASLIDPLIARCNEMGVTVDQIKEKYGSLRFYVSGPWDDQLQEMIDKAEDASAQICEICGKPGILMQRHGWLKTLCAEDSLDLGYKDRA